MTGEKIRLLLVDDHALVREGLRQMLSTQPGLEVIGEAPNGSIALAMVKKQRPDIVLMDITMPGMNGIEATRAINDMGLGVKVLGLTVHENVEYFFRMLVAGASGYILKGASSVELVSAIRSVYQGGVFVSSAVTSHMVNEYSLYKDIALKAGQEGLTARETDVLRLIAKGLTNQEAADALNLSIYTIHTHRANIMKKLGLENRQQLMAYAIRKGYVDTNT
ncbi:MAG: response regulator transcription factor [Dehalococcoidia bacterium]|nr:nreC [Dehalococcoidia bacterium]MDO8636716.1 response regulator transcription factor [Dehalococcoidia bacterium]